MSFPISSVPATTLTSSTINQVAHGFVANDWVYLSAASTYAKADADVPTTADSIGIVTTVVDANNFKISVAGYVTGLTGLVATNAYFLSSTAGAITAIEPTGVSTTRKPVLIADSTTSGWLIDRTGTPVVGTTAVVAYGENLGITNAQTIGTSLADITGSSFTLPVAGTYNVEFTVTASNSVTSVGTIAIYTAGDVLVAGSQSQIQIVTDKTQFIGNATIIVSAATTYKLKGQTSVGTLTISNVPSTFSATAGASRIYWTQIGASPVPMDLLGENGTVTLGANLAVLATTDTDVMSFTLPTAGLWEVDYFLLFLVGGSFTSRSVWVTDSSNVVVTNSAVSTTENVAGINSGPTIVGMARIITTQAATYKVRVRSIVAGTIYSSGAPLLAGAPADVVTKVSYKKISGFMPSSGQTVDYVNVRGTVAQTTGLTATNPILFSTPSTTGNIPFNSGNGQFTLSAGKTYNLTGSMGQAAVGAGGIAIVQWRDITNNVLIGIAQQVNADTASAQTSIQGITPATAIITPSTNITVRLEIIFSGTLTSLGVSDANGVRMPYASIIQLGSSAYLTNGSTLGTAVLAAGTVVVPLTSVTATTNIQLTNNVLGGTAGFLRVSARTVGTSFTILSSSATDTSTVAYIATN